MSGEGAWRVRPFAPGDEASLTGMFERVFGRPMTTAHYQWKLLDAPGRASIPNVWVAEADGRIIGQYAAAPVRFHLEGRVVTALHGCDVMTDLGWRRRGVLTDLGTRAHRAWREAGVPFVYGLHYGGWGSRRQHLGWREMFSARWLWHPLDAAQLLQDRLPGPDALARVVALPATVGSATARAIAAVRGRSVVVEAAKQDDIEVFDQLWSKLKREDDARVVRDGAWVRHRYLGAPDREYGLLVARRQSEPCGYLAYAVRDGRGSLVDLFTAPADAACQAALLAELFEMMRARGVRHVRALIPLPGPLAPTLLTAGFLPARGRYDVSLVWLGRGTPSRALTAPSRWLTTGGDFDVL